MTATPQEWMRRLERFVAEAGRMPSRRRGEAELYVWIVQVRAGLVEVPGAMRVQLAQMLADTPRTAVAGPDLVAARRRLTELAAFVDEHGRLPRSTDNATLSQWVRDRRNGTAALPPDLVDWFATLVNRGSVATAPVLLGPVKRRASTEEMLVELRRFVVEHARLPRNRAGEGRLHALVRRVQHGEKYLTNSQRIRFDEVVQMGVAAQRQRQRAERRDLLEAWLESCYTNGNVVNAYRSIVGTWLSWCGRHRVDPLSADLAHLEAWVSQQQDELVAEETLMTRLRLAGGWYRWVAERQPAGAGDPGYAAEMCGVLAEELRVRRRAQAPSEAAATQRVVAWTIDEAGQEGVRVRDIAAVAGYTKSRAQQVLAAMVARGELERAPQARYRRVVQRPTE